MKAAKPVLVLAVMAAIAGAVTYGLFLRFGGPDILVTDAVAVPARSDAKSIDVFLEIDNRGGPDRLVAARSITAQRTRLVAAVADAGLPIPAGSHASLAPDGAHIRLEGVGGDLKDGRLIPLTLRFEKANEINTRVRLSTQMQRDGQDDAGLHGMSDALSIDSAAAPRLSLDVRTDGDGWIVTARIENFQFAPKLVNGEHVPGTGHGHLYLGGLKLQRVFEPEIRLEGLPAGTHEVRVTLNTNDHRTYVAGDVPVSATATIVAP